MKSMRLKKGKTVKFRKMATIFNKNKGLKSKKVCSGTLFSHPYTHPSRSFGACIIVMLTMNRILKEL